MNITWDVILIFYSFSGIIIIFLCRLLFGVAGEKVIKRKGRQFPFFNLLAPSYKRENYDNKLTYFLALAQWALLLIFIIAFTYSFYCY